MRSVLPPRSQPRLLPARSSLDPRRLLRAAAPAGVHPLTAALLATIALLVAANVALGMYEELSGTQANGTLANLVHLNVEWNLPSTFSAVQLAIAAALLLGIARAEARTEARSDSRLSRHWLALGVGFVYLAVDEAVQLHERLLPPLIGDPELGGAFRHVWVIPAMAMVAVAAAAFLPFLRRLPRRTGVLLALAGAVYVGAAIGGEMLGAISFARYGQGAVTGATVTLEEGSEMLGVLLLIHALLDFRARRPALGSEAAPPA